MPANQIVIIGGGIAGLATAFYTLKKATAASQPVHLTVLESSSRWGG
ncbi:MAG: NAD(P)-binding protein [Chloroflexi bacterium]|nr:NAD(P)-binding protein [Chloroflexota bacterium]